VPDQRGRGKDGEGWGVNVARVLPFLTFVAAVDRQRALDDVQGQKAEYGGQHDRRNAEQLVGLLAECSGTRSKPTTPSMSPAESPRA
jgi:hypothetical protein